MTPMLRKMSAHKSSSVSVFAIANITLTAITAALKSQLSVQIQWYFRLIHHSSWFMTLTSADISLKI